MAAPGHPNSNNPVIHTADGQYVTTADGNPDDVGMVNDVGEPDPTVTCPTCGGRGRVPAVTEADLEDVKPDMLGNTGRAMADAYPAAVGEWGFRSGLIRATPMPRQ